MLVKPKALRERTKMPIMPQRTAPLKAIKTPLEWELIKSPSKKVKYMLIILYKKQNINTKALEMKYFLLPKCFYTQYILKLCIFSF